MGSHLVSSVLLCGLLSIGGCKKAGQPKAGQIADSSAIVGKWTWVGSGFAGGKSYLITPGSGVQKSLNFLADGILYVTHNDTPGTTAYLNVYDTLGLLPNLVVTEQRFRLGSEPDGCVSDKYPAVITTGAAVTEYQYSIAGDTLQISFSPCLAPFTTYYIRN